MTNEEKLCHARILTSAVTFSVGTAIKFIDLTRFSKTLIAKVHVPWSIGSFIIWRFLYF